MSELKKYRSPSKSTYWIENGVVMFQNKVTLRIQPSRDWADIKKFEKGIESGRFKLIERKKYVRGM